MFAHGVQRRTWTSSATVQSRRSFEYSYIYMCINYEYYKDRGGSNIWNIGYWTCAMFQLLIWPSSWSDLVYSILL